MTRPYRLSPDGLARRRAAMKALNADPEFAKANSERMKRLHADPEFAKANSERMKRLNAAKWHCPPELKPFYTKLRRLLGIVAARKEIERERRAA